MRAKLAKPIAWVVGCVMGAGRDGGASTTTWMRSIDTVTRGGSAAAETGADVPTLSASTAEGSGVRGLPGSFLEARWSSNIRTALRGVDLGSTRGVARGASATGQGSDAAELADGSAAGKATCGGSDAGTTRAGTTADGEAILPGGCEGGTGGTPLSMGCTRMDWAATGGATSGRGISACGCVALGGVCGDGVATSETGTNAASPISPSVTPPIGSNRARPRGASTGLPG